MADVDDAPEADAIVAALAAGACVLVDGDLATVAERREVLALGGAAPRVLVEWSCARHEAEREIFHRYKSRPAVLSAAEFERYLEDARVRQPVGSELEAGRVVRLSPELPRDEQLERVVAALPEPPEPRRVDGERRVMVVEDDADQRALIADVLAELGFVVELAPDAGVALALLDDGAEVELLISDHRMPGMSGVELSRTLAARHPTVRTVLLTAYGDEELARQAMGAHALTVLSKPLSVIDLERVLDESIS